MILFLIAIAASISLSEQAVIVRQNVASDRIDIEWTNTQKLAISIPLIQGLIQKNVNITNGQPAIEKSTTDDTVTEEPTTESPLVSTISTEVTTEEPSNPQTTDLPELEVTGVTEEPILGTSEPISEDVDPTESPTSKPEKETETTSEPEKVTESTSEPVVEPVTSEPKISIPAEVKATEEPENPETESAPTSEPEEEVTGSTEEPEFESVTEPDSEPETEDPEIETEEPTTQSTTTEQPTTESTTTAATTTTTTQAPDIEEIRGHRCLKTANNRYIRIHPRDRGEPVYPIVPDNWVVELVPHCKSNEDWNIVPVEGGVKLEGYVLNNKADVAKPYMTALADGTVGVATASQQTWKPHKNVDGSWSFESPNGTWLSWPLGDDILPLSTAQQKGPHEQFTIEPYTWKGTK